MNRQDILDRLHKEGHITTAELLLFLENEEPKNNQKIFKSAFEDKKDVYGPASGYSELTLTG